MTKKSIMSCIALAAVSVFALPVTALAANDPTLTEGGVAVAKGATVVGTAGNIEFQSTGGANLVTCSSAMISGTVLTNSGGTVEGEITKVGFSSTGAVHTDNGLNECTGSFGNAYMTVTNLPLCLRSSPLMATDEFQIDGGGCLISKKVKFLLGTTTAGECEWETTGVITGTYTTGGTQASITVNNTQAGSGISKIRGGFLCPSSEMLKMTFTLEKQGGNALTIS